MAQNADKKDLKKDWAFRQAILGGRKIKIKKHFYCVKCIKDLQIITINSNKDNKTTEFTATAEFYFYTIDNNGFTSTGNRSKFRGKVYNENGKYILVDDLILEEEVNCNTYKICDDI